MQEVLQSLKQLAHEIGREDRKLAILGEGNVSARISAAEFLVKASGSCLGNLSAEDLIACRSDLILPLLDHGEVTDAETEAALLEARVNSGSRKPSTETVFHAWLLTLENINFVGHCHPTAANQILCSPRARDLSEHRLFPDEVVCCGPASVFVPYADPGIPLALEIRKRTTDFIDDYRAVPRLILLENHGIIALGSTPQAVLGCVLMATKAAEIFIGAATLGGPNYMSLKDIDRIVSRPDEAYRQRQLNI